jgi:hypothetical protein
MDNMLKILTFLIDQSVSHSLRSFPDTDKQTNISVEDVLSLEQLKFVDQIINFILHNINLSSLVSQQEIIFKIIENIGIPVFSSYIADKYNIKLII